MASGKRSPGRFVAAETALRAHAMAKPEATEHFPWGERAIKVKGKVFVFMFGDASQLSLSIKLPESNGVALMLPFTKPTGYGLGKAGWVSAAFEGAIQPPIELLCDWIDESYQAVAPAKLAALAGAGVDDSAKPKTAPPQTAPPRPAKSPAAKSRTAKSRTAKSRTAKSRTAKSRAKKRG